MVVQTLRQPDKAMDKAPEKSPNLKTLSGTVERVTYQNEENGYTIARLAEEGGKNRQNTPSTAKGDDKLVTIVGNMIGVVAGEALELSGFWLNNPQYGWQFKVESYRSTLPATAQGIRKYLGSGLIKGIGPKTAERIVAHFDTETMDILDLEPKRLLEVPKLGKHKANLIAKAWLEQKAIKEVMVFLQGQGVSTSLAVRIYKRFGDASISIVKNQPYLLAREVWGIGFKTADKIAQALGFKHDDPERIKAGTLFALNEASDGDGHTYLPRPKLVEKAAELLGVTAEQVDKAIDGLVLDDGIRLEALTTQPKGVASFEPVVKLQVFEPDDHTQVRDSTVEYQITPRIEHVAVEGEQAVYLPAFYHSEVGITRHLLRLYRCPIEKDRLKDLKQINFKAMFDYLSTKNSKLELADKQREGVVMALTQPVGVLTGGPGTGKTTSMRALVRVLIIKKKRVMLAAPTGRAAKRLSEATGLEAKTLHRLLGLKPGSKPLHDQDNPIPCDILILDETSMCDVIVMNQVLKALATGTHLLLVGDADQLPSVGAGNVLSDVINSGAIPVVRLDHIFRQGAGSAIITNAHRINEGQVPVVNRDITDFFIFAEEDQEKAADLVVDLVNHKIPKRFGFTTADIQVLAPMHRGRCGVGYLNEKLQETLNPEHPAKAQKQYGGKVFRVGDKVLQMRNNYDKEVFNGDSGLVKVINNEDQTVTVDLEDGRTVEYDFAELDELTLAYAVSIHKSQGSDYPVCVIPMVMGHYMLLERKLLYTAVTRAKKLVVLVGSKRAIAMAVRNGPSRDSDGRPVQARRDRFTGLMSRLHYGLLEMIRQEG
jgi:exodeoxyribonuclease V alpha subunit